MSKVSIVPCPTSYEGREVSAAVRQALDGLGGVGRFVRKGAKVLLKPNLLGPRRPEEAATTHPAIVRAVAEIVREAGGIVTIADSPGGPYIAPFLRKVYSVSGMEEVAQETGASLNYDLSEVEVAVPDARLLRRIGILRPAAEADVIINLPKLKTHGQMVFTGAVKNMFGIIAGTAKIDYHLRMSEYERFADALIDICLAAKPSLNILDAAIGMEGAGPSAGEPRAIGWLLAGEDAFALDAVALRMIGCDLRDVPVSKAAIDRGLCPPDVAAIEIVPPAARDVRVERFDIPARHAMASVLWSRMKVTRVVAEWLKPRPVFLHEVCTGCGHCVEVCPPKVISLRDGKPQADLAGCIRCFCCQELCPAKAVAVKRLPRAVGGVLRLAFFVISWLLGRTQR